MLVFTLLSCWTFTSETRQVLTDATLTNNDCLSSSMATSQPLLSVQLAREKASNVCVFLVSLLVVYLSRSSAIVEGPRDARAR